MNWKILNWFKGSDEEPAVDQMTRSTRFIIATWCCVIMSIAFMVAFIHALNSDTERAEIFLHYSQNIAMAIGGAASIYMGARSFRPSRHGSYWKSSETQSETPTGTDPAPEVDPTGSDSEES